MSEGLQMMAYFAASLLFIFSLRGLSSQETAGQGNTFGIVGMLIAVGITAAAMLFPAAEPVAEVAQAGAEAAQSGHLGVALGMLGGAVGIGAVIGAVLAARVQMTSMPQLVAILHSFVGLAAVLVGIGSYLQPPVHGGADLVHLIEVYVGVFVGAVTFTGSVVAWGKLEGKIGSRPLLLPGRHVLNAVAMLGTVTMGVLFAMAPGTEGVHWLLGMTAIAGLLGIHLVMAIGGGDMPVVVSLLNSYSGWAASAAGFMLSNDLLIITGALVGSSGAILSLIMCRAMNRSIWNVVFGGFGTEQPKKKPKEGEAEPQGEVQAVEVDEVADMLMAARRVIIIPGYGMAVAQAQHPVKDVTTLLRDHGVDVRYAIHPVAGRLPGHMNVLLAEANVPYDIVLEMDEINDDFPRTDVSVVIGANDIVNPDALDDESSPIYGMPVLEAWKSDKVIVLKRSMGAGYAGIDNPLFVNDNTRMLFGDAKDSMSRLLSRLRELNDAS